MTARSAAFFFFSLVSASALAETPDEMVRRGVDEYASGQFDDAQKTLSSALLRGGETKTLVLAQKYLAAASIILGDRARGRDAFIAALKLDPLTTFDRKRFPAAVVETFLQVRKEVGGSIKVNCNRDDATVEIVGEARGRCGATVDVPVGAHKVRVTSGPDEQERGVTVFFKSVTPVDFKFTEAAGFLSVTSLPDGAEVTLDGKAIGRTPIDKRTVAPGRHLLEVALDGYAARERSIVVLPTRETVSSFVLSKVEKILRTPPPPAKVVSKTQRTWGWIAAVLGGVVTVAGGLTGIIILANKEDDYTGTQKTADNIETYNALRVFSPIALGAGAVVAAAGVYLLVTDRKKVGQVSFDVAPVASLGGAVVAVVRGRVEF